MDETSNTNNNGRRQRRRLNNEFPDLLTSLPYSIIAEILSLLPITSAAATSTLSRRWRHLWTGVTSFHLNLNLSEKTSHSILTLVYNILQQLTSTKLTSFHLTLPSESNLDDLDLTEPCFREIIRRNVDRIVFDAGFRSFFRVPANCVFNSQSLVNLQLLGLLKIELIDDFVIHLPNLKKLKLCYLIDVPSWLETVFDCCPLLEELQLSFDLVIMPQPQNVRSIVNIFCPNLKSLVICMRSWNHLPRTKISIDAPKLENLDIRDCNSLYYLVQNLTSLVNALIDLRNVEELLDEELLNEELGDGELSYIDRMSMFFGRMSSVRNLQLEVENRSNILTRLHYVNMPVFSNLVSVKTNIFKDLILSLQYFPNLRHINVSLWLEGDLQMEQRNWCTPDVVPDCLVSKLKTLQIGGLKGIGDDLDLLAYILSNAMVLERLCIKLRIKVEAASEAAYALWKECQFCKSVFSLSRSSSTCKVVVSGKRVTASGDALKNGYLTCNVFMG